MHLTWIIKHLIIKNEQLQLARKLKLINLIYSTRLVELITKDLRLNLAMAPRKRLGGSAIQQKKGAGEVEGRGWTIGVVSDTHGVFDSHLNAVFDGVNEIWHAGDHAGRDELSKIAPVTNVVRGNVDTFAGGLLGHRGHNLGALRSLQSAYPLATLVPISHAAGRRRCGVDDASGVDDAFSEKESERNVRRRGDGQGASGSGGATGHDGRRGWVQEAGTAVLLHI